MAKILVLDVGNSNIKCLVFDVDLFFEKPHNTQLLHQEKQKTNRGHPWDLRDTVRNMIQRAQDAHNPQCGIITAFGDAFVHYDPRENGRPRFVFADQEVGDFAYDYDYESSGFPNKNIGIKGVGRLMRDCNAAFEDIVPVNIFLGISLCTSPAAVSKGAIDTEKTWRSWDFTQASTTGLLDLKILLNRVGYMGYKHPPCDPYDQIGTFNGMPILAGGLDNAFLDTIETSPYIMAGTWLVVSGVKNAFEPTDELHDIGARWMISGNGRYLVQTVRKSDDVFVKTVPNIIGDLEVMGYDCTKYQRIRVIGGYSSALTKYLGEYVSDSDGLAYEFVDCGESFDSTAMYVYQHYPMLEHINIDIDAPESRVVELEHGDMM